MRQPDNRRDVELFDEIFADRDRAVKAVRYRLKIDGERYVPTALSASRDRGAPAFVLDGSVASPLHRSLKRKRVVVELSIEGRRWTDYRGFVVRLAEDADQSGQFAAATAGFYQGGDEASVKFGEKTEYNVRPHIALSDMLRRFPYDDINVQRLPGRFVRIGTDAYQRISAVGDAIADVEEAAGIEQFDRPLNRAAVQVDGPISTLVEGPKLSRWQVGREILSFSATSRSDAEFRDVDVVQQTPTGEYLSVLRSPIRVRYPPDVDPPPVGCTYYEEIGPNEFDNVPLAGPDEGLDAETVATNRAFALARSLGFGGEWDVNIVLPFIDPRIEDFDEREVVRVNRETGHREFFRVRIESHTRDYVEGTMTLNCLGAMVWREPVRERALDVVPERSGIGTALVGSDGPVLAGDERTIDELGDVTIDELSPA